MAADADVRKIIAANVGHAAPGDAAQPRTARSTRSVRPSAVAQGSASVAAR
jgi:hypothetical protein